MKKLLFFVALAVLLVACNNITGIRGSGTSKTETRNVSGFKEIKANGAIDLDVTFKPEYSLTIEADDNLLEYITTDVNGGTLIIESRDEKINPKRKINVRITMPELVGLEINGASTGSVAGVKTDKLDLSINGASRLKIDGEVRELKVKAVGASSVDAEGLKTENANVDASGASSITVNATGDLSANASGASSVKYVGEPKNLKQNSSGASSVKKKS
jgi:hypothetical protein